MQLLSCASQSHCSRKQVGIDGDKSSQKYSVQKYSVQKYSVTRCELRKHPVEIHGVAKVAPFV